MLHLSTGQFCSVYISDSWEDRWVESKHKSDLGKFKLSAGKFYGDAEKDKGRVNTHEK